MQEHHSRSQISRKQLQWTARILLTVSVFLTYVPLNGQTEFKGYAFNLKAGICSGKNFEGFGAGLEFDVISNENLLSLDIYTAAHVSYTGNSTAKFSQLGILYGRYTGTKQVRLQYQGGLAPTWGTKKGYYTDNEYVEPESYFTLGLTGKLGLKFLISPSVSFGVDLQGNLNFKNPMFFPSVSIEIGKLRERDAVPIGYSVN